MSVSREGRDVIVEDVRVRKVRARALTIKRLCQIHLSSTAIFKRWASTTLMGIDARLDLRSMPGVFPWSTVSGQFGFQRRNELAQLAKI